MDEAKPLIRRYILKIMTNSGFTDKKKKIRKFDQTSKCKKYLILCVIVIALFLVDAFNFLGKINLCLNYDAWNVIVVIGIAFITYSLIDERNENRKNNQERVALTLLAHTYDEAEDFAKMMDNDIFLKIVPVRFPGDQLLGQNSSYQKLRNGPFLYDEQIFDFAKQGVITADQLKEYMKVAEYYHKYVNTYIVFSDQDQMKNQVKDELQNCVAEARKGITKCQQ